MHAVKLSAFAAVSRSEFPAECLHCPLQPDSVPELSCLASLGSMSSKSCRGLGTEQSFRVACLTLELLEAASTIDLQPVLHAN